MRQDRSNRDVSLRRTSLPLLVAALVTAINAPAAAAQDCTWLSTTGFGLNDVAHAAVTWDPDGAGPQPPLLIIGGSFTTAGGVPAAHIAAWDGSAWQPLGAGTNDSVRALAVYNGELIAAGFFTTAGGVACSHIARWNGTAWQPLGSGANGDVYTLSNYDGALIAGGAFVIAGNPPCSRVARWNGSAWQPLGLGISGGGLFCRVIALAVHEGGLFAGGYFTLSGLQTCNCIARWDGSAWNPLGSGTDGTVRALFSYQGDLLVCGDFHSADGVQCSNARWNAGAFEPLDMAGVHPESLTIYNGELFAAGSSSDLFRAGIASWTAGVWQTLGSDLAGGLPGNEPGWSTVYALTVYNGELIAAGKFGTAGGNTSENWARWGCPAGACCFTDGHCERQTRIDCLAASANYLGDNSTCSSPCAPVPCLADCNCDQLLDWHDIDFFVNGLNDNQSHWAAHFPGAGPTCPYANLDCNNDGHVTWRDIDPFVWRLNKSCP